ncbi:MULTISPECIES: flagellar hook-length control protein FliK [unclassified Serratia (in: enterobacteria)]|uniref:flagellar hook-length control protein FliK n=1 Tax=unclassified Serratia (in: enterobacteria) TaxID=2647522 RepID=UPI003075F3B1
MNLNLLSGLLAASDNLATGEAAVPLSDSELSSAFAQLLGARFTPAGKPNGKLTTAQLQAAMPEAPALSHHPLSPQLEKAGLLGLAKPQEVLLDASTLADQTAPSLAEKPDESPSAPLQALFAMLPAVQTPRPNGSETLADARDAKSTDLLSVQSDKPSEPAPSVAQQKPQAALTDKTPLAAKTDTATLIPDSTAGRAVPPGKLTVEPAQPVATAGHGTPTAVASPLPPAAAFNTTASAALTPQLQAPLGSPEWQQALGQQVLMFQRNGQHNAELRLHPQELGALQITLKLDDNQAQLHIASAHGQVRSAVEAALPQLRQALAESGINLGQSSVGSESLPQQSPQQHSQGGGQPGYREQPGHSESPLENLTPPATLHAMARAVDGVDIFA